MSQCYWSGWASWTLKIASFSLHLVFMHVVPNKQLSDFLFTGFSPIGKPSKNATSSLEKSYPWKRRHFSLVEFFGIHILDEENPLFKMVGKKPAEFERTLSSGAGGSLGSLKGREGKKFFFQAVKFGAKKRPKGRRKGKYLRYRKSKKVLPFSPGEKDKKAFDFQIFFMWKQIFFLFN